jgi:hypothetical protein
MGNSVATQTCTVQVVVTDITICISCGQKWPKPHLKHCPYYYSKGNVDGVEPRAEISGRQQGKSEVSFDVMIQKLEEGATVWTKLPDE